MPSLFTRIIQGEIPCHKILEDNDHLAFLDINPINSGHTLVIPKGVEARNLLDMPGDKVGPFMQRVQLVARAVEAALKPDGVVVTQFNGAPAGQTVFHLHFHILPRRLGGPLRPHAAGEMAKIEDLQAIAAKIRPQAETFLLD